MSSISTGSVVFDLLARREVIEGLLDGLSPSDDGCADVSVCAVHVPGDGVPWYRAHVEDFFDVEMYRPFWNACISVNGPDVTAGGIWVTVSSDDDGEVGDHVVVAGYGFADVCATYRGQPILREVLDDLVVDSCMSWNELLTEAASRTSEWVREKTSIADLSRYGAQVSDDVQWDGTADGADRLFEELDSAVKVV